MGDVRQHQKRGRRRYSVKRSLSVHSHLEVTVEHDSLCGKEDGLPTGCEIEKDEDIVGRQRLNQRQITRARVSSGAAGSLRSSAELEPILLRRSAKYGSEKVTVPPPVRDTQYERRILFKQPMNVGYTVLTPSAAEQKLLPCLLYGALKHIASTVFVLSSPTYEVRFEMLPPRKRVEVFHNEELCTAELLLRPSDSGAAEVFKMQWLPVKYTVAYGRHVAVAHSIDAPRRQRVHHRRARGEPLYPIDVRRLAPDEPPLSKVLCRAPAKHQIQLKTADSTTEAREVQEIVVDEHYASAYVHTYEFDVTYTENSECTFEAQ